jgi:type III restriction enzyme
VAETDDAILVIETKARNELAAADVLAKRDAAVVWCERATDHAVSNSGKPWTYVLIPHDAVASNMTMDALVQQHRSAL